MPASVWTPKTRHRLAAIEQVTVVDTEPDKQDQALSVMAERARFKIGKRG